jgi:phosphatidylinositol kinase/protein kinase (PI-3  family)
MGEIHLEGIYSSVMSSAALCFSHYKDQIKDHLTLFLREDYLDWQSSDELLYNESEKDKSMEVEIKKKVADAVELNVNSVLEKIKSLESPAAYSPEDKHLYNIPINKRVMELIDAAQHPSRISQTDPTWLNFI